ncbi:MAG: putative transport system permease protein [Acidobacteriota bacterium]
MTLWIEQFWRDIRFGARHLAATRGVSALAIASLAAGVMATTAIYSVVHAVILDPFPYKRVDHLMSVMVTGAAQRGGRTGYSVDQFLEIADRNTIFDGVVASTISDVLWDSGVEPKRVRGNYGTFNTFDVMGVPPLLGRTPGPDDRKPGAAPVVVLGYRFWQRQFGGDPQVLGRPLRLNDTIRTVIGVMPKRFMWRGADVYLPTAFQRGQVIEGVRSVHLLGRLRDGVTAPQADADLRPIIADLQKREPRQFPEQWRVALQPFSETFRSGIVGDLWVLFGAVGLLLLIACANVSNLLLSKATGRQREMTVRVALGASRRRIVSQLLTESLLLAFAAAALGVAFAYAGLPAILAIVPPDTIPDEAEVTLNLPVLAFTLGLALVTSLVCGLAPALHSSRRDLATTMRAAGRGIAGSPAQARVRKAFVVAQVALSLMLLVGASLLIRTFMAMEQVDLGYPADRVLVLRVPMSALHYPDAPRRIAFFRDLVERVRAVPGVSAVGLNTGLHPLGNMGTSAEVTGAPPSPDPVQVHQINPDYPAVFSIRLREGRLFTDADMAAAPTVALVNERFVHLRLDNRPPLGQVVRLPRLKEPPFLMKNDAFQIVGVLHDTLNQGLTTAPVPEIYLPFTATGQSNMVTVRTLMNPDDLRRAVVGAVSAIDRNQAVSEVRTLEAILRDEQYAAPRFSVVLFSIFGAIGLALAVIGVYGVVSSTVALQRHEIGVRMALGAEAGTIARMVILRGSRLLLAGMAAGLVGSLLGTRILAGELWQVSVFDPVAFGAVSAILLVAGLQACLWPALRAGRTDPVTALRQD